MTATTHGWTLFDNRIRLCRKQGAFLFQPFTNALIAARARPANESGWVERRSPLYQMEVRSIMTKEANPQAAGKVKIDRITITRGEGPTHLCGIPHTASTWREAGDILKRMAASAPAEGGYDKTDFEIVFSNGERYSGRYDLKRHDEIYGDLYRHVVRYCEYYAGRRRPMQSAKTNTKLPFAIIRISMRHSSGMCCLPAMKRVRFRNAYAACREYRSNGRSSISHSSCHAETESSRRQRRGSG